MRKGWQKKRLVEVCKKITDGSHNPPKGVDFSDFLMLSSKNVFDDLIHFEDPRYLTAKDFESENKRTEVKHNDVLLTIVGTIGRVAVVPPNHPKITLQRSVAVLKVNELLLNSRFLMFSLQNKLKFLSEEARGVAQKGIYLNQLKEIEIELPSPQEQKRIVAILDGAFAAIAKEKANTEKNLKNAKELFESYLQGVFENKGGDWDKKKLSEICEVKDGTHDSPKYVKEGIPFVTQKNIRLNGLSFADTKFITHTDHDKFYKRSNVSFGDILISMIGANRGMACLVDDKRIFSIKNVGLIKENEKINMHFLLYYLKSPVAMKYVLDMSNGGAQEFVGLTALRNFPVPFPPLKIQRVIVQKLDALSSETKRLEANYQQKIDALEELRKSILQKAFTGEVTSKAVMA